jgi:glutamate decarboxylase
MSNSHPKCPLAVCCCCAVGCSCFVVSFRPAGDPGCTEFDVSRSLRAYGWRVPAYTMPDDASDVAVLRVVVREGFSADLARALKDDTIAALAQLDEF